MENQSCKIIIAAFRRGILTALLKDGKAVQLNYEYGAGSEVGNIYIGRVQHLVENINAAFLDIGDGKRVYYSLEENPVHLYADRKEHDRLKEGDEIIVKIRKDAFKTKNAVCTSRFSEAVKSGFLKLAEFRKAPCLIQKAEPFWEYLLHVTGNGCESVTDIREVFETAAEKKLNVRLYEDRMLPLMKLYSLETAVSEATSRSLWLKSGATLVIDYTEAMTVIDVNTGKSLAKGSREEVVLKTDLEAAEEIMRQLRLRNLSGIILIDFIDLKTEAEKTMLLSRLRELCLSDPVECTVVDMTRLNLVEMTRKKAGKPLYDQLKAVPKQPEFVPGHRGARNRF